MVFHEHLAAMFTDWEGARDWLNAPSRYLAGLTPLEAMRAGRVDRAREALLALSVAGLDGVKFVLGAGAVEGLTFVTASLEVGDDC